MRTSPRTFFLIALFALLFANPSYAAPAVVTERSKAELIIESTPLKAGESIWVGVALTMQPKWHHYWVNPGDSGMSALFEWSVPEGFSAGPIHWPTPKRIEYADLYNYGYSGSKALLVPLQAPENLEGGAYNVALNASWLVCKDICIPEEATFTFTLSTQTAPAENAMPDGDLSVYLQAIPSPYKSTASYDITDQVNLHFDLEPLPVGDIKHVWWFPQDDGIIANGSDQPFDITENVLTIHAKRSWEDPLENYKGILQIEDENRIHHYHVAATFKQRAPATTLAASEESRAIPDNASSMTLFGAILFAFVGGIILNIMPCVLPILSLKALSIAKKSGKEAGKVRIQGLAYTAGVLVSFSSIAGLLMILQQAGHTIGWGFQLQSPAFVTVLTYVLFLVGLNLSGVFELSFSFVGIGQKGTQGDTVHASFFTGVLATLVATPCTAPFMATAIGFALSQPAIYALLIFLSLGFGLAFPLLVVSFLPPLYRLLPKPGTWMVRFKQFLAFPIYASAAWMLWVLAQQAGPMGLAAALAGLCLLGFAAWLVPLLQHTISRLLALIIVAVLSIITIQQQHPIVTATPAVSHKTLSEPFSMQRLNDYRAQGVPVFVDATAAWCITCKVNEKVALSADSVRAAFVQHGIKLLIADWTSRDAEITDYLASFGRNGVPIYVYYAPGAEPVVLPQILTPSIVLDAIK